MLLGAVGGSGVASAQSLTEALAEAYRTNPQLLAQRALLRATDEMAPQALANWRPTVAFTGQTGYAVNTLSTSGGRVMWEFNMVQEYKTVNGVAAKGGSMGAAGPTVAGGMLFAGAGYPGPPGGMPGNVLLAFGVE